MSQVTSGLSSKSIYNERQANVRKNLTHNMLTNGQSKTIPEFHQVNNSASPRISYSLTSSDSETANSSSSRPSSSRLTPLKRGSRTSLDARSNRFIISYQSLFNQSPTIALLVLRILPIFIGFKFSLISVHYAQNKINIAMLIFC